MPNLRVKTYEVLPIKSHYLDVISSCPYAKFVVALLSTETSNASGLSETHASEFIRQSQLSSAVDSAKVLEIEIGGADNHAGETWERLCRFLGLGYSVLERKGLRKFPGEMGGREELRRELGGRFSYGYGGIGGGIST